MNYVNLCPHAIHICGEDGSIVRTIEPSGTVARCNEASRYLGSNPPDDIPLILRKYGAVDGLPNEQDWPPTILFIVSNMVRQALPERLDIASPGDAVRDDQGRIIGVKNLIVNEA